MDRGFFLVEWCNEVNTAVTERLDRDRSDRTRSTAGPLRGNAALAIPSSSRRQREENNTSIETAPERDYPMSSAETKPTPRRTPGRAKASTDQLVRLNVNLNAETAEALKEIADHRGISFTEAVRRAISVYKFIDDETQEGRHIQTVSADRNEVRELVLM
jgi:hypothetical protein